MSSTEDLPSGPVQGSGGQPRLLQIDGLRGLAALAVVMFHYTTRYDLVFAHSEPLPFSFSYGYLGVQLFFGISGFVIFMTLERVQAPLDFVVSRFSRLFPTYWTAVAVTALVLMLAGLPGYQPSLKVIVANLSMVQELFGIPSIDGAYWSLEIELIFYVWMLALWAVGFLKYPVLVFGVWIVVVMTAQWLGGDAGLFQVPHGISHVLLFKWIPWFSLGISAYLVLREGKLSVGALFLVCLATGAIWIRWGTVLSLLGLLFFAVISLASYGRVTLLNWRPFVALGAVSYPLYLLHDKIGIVTIMQLESRAVPPMVAILIALFASILAAAAAHFMVEIRASKGIRNWYRSCKQIAGTAAANGRRQSIQRPLAPVRWVVACALVLCIAMGGGRISHLLRGEARAAAPSRQPAMNHWAPEDNATREACKRLIGQRAPLVIVLGQSNAASHGEPVATPLQTWVFHQGVCGQRADPLPGTTGKGASIWPLLAQKLRTGAAMTQRGEVAGAEVVFAPVAIDATRIAAWVTDGPVNAALRAQLEHVASSGFTVKAVVWQQGEADMLAGTENVSYQASLATLGLILQQHGVDAPLFLANSTYCRQFGSGAIRRAVARHLTSNTGGRFRAGADTDRLLGEHRYGGCHFSQLGLEKASSLWADTLKSDLEVHD